MNGACEFCFVTGKWNQLQLRHPSSVCGWLDAVGDRSFYLLGSVLCAALKLVIVLGKNVDSTQCLSCWNNIQTYKAAELDSSVQKQRKKKKKGLVCG